NARAALDDGGPANVLTQDQWRRVDIAVERGLRFLASQQEQDGSFPTMPTAQPAVSSLCMMAFAAHGHVPDGGPYGERVGRALDFAIACQKPNGLVTQLGPEGPRINRNISHEIGSTAAYNHAISSLVLSELYGMTPPRRARRLEAVI